MPGQQTGNPGQNDDGRLDTGAGDSHHQGEVADEPVAGAKDNRSQDRVCPSFVTARRIGQLPRPEREQAATRPVHAGSPPMRLVLQA